MKSHKDLTHLNCKYMPEKASPIKSNGADSTSDVICESNDADIKQPIQRKATEIINTHKKIIKHHRTLGRYVT